MNQSGDVWYGGAGFVYQVKMMKLQGFLHWHVSHGDYYYFMSYDSYRAEHVEILNGCKF